MKLTKDTLIEGKIVKEGSRIEVKSSLIENISLFPNLQYAVKEKGIRYFELATYQPMFTLEFSRPATNIGANNIAIKGNKGEMIIIETQDIDEIIITDTNREDEPTEFQLIMKSSSRISILLND